MIIHYHNRLEATTPYPGLHRLMSMDQSLGSGAITQGIVMIEPGRQSRPHTHLIEESMMLLEGSLRVLIGNEVTGVHARATFLAPATTVHGGSSRVEGV